MKPTFYSRFGKRWLDFTCAVVGLVLLSPLLLVIALAVRLTSRGPAFFRQVRVGQFGRHFSICKFRSMTGKPSGRGALLTATGDPRITPLGRWLRKTKVDELPQLFNVLWGDMSIVGPRPEVPVYVAAFDERQKSILAARPGLTGISANVREEELMAGHADKEAFYLNTVLPAKLEFDIAYCQNISLANDLKVIFNTAGALLSRMLELSHLFSPSSPKRANQPSNEEA